jgi:hypothetical protein
VTVFCDRWKPNSQRSTQMKMTRIVMLSLTVVVYATAGLGQHGHSGGGMGGPMGSSMGHSIGASDHGNAGNMKATNSGSTDRSNVNDILAKNPAIGGKIQTLTGMPASQACTGFKNLGQCVAAAHVSKNLGISFDCLKSDVTGTAPQSTSCPAGTGTKRMSLGKAIQTLDPQADQKTESKKGETEAQQDMKTSGVKS